MSVMDILRVSLRTGVSASIGLILWDQLLLPTITSNIGAVSNISQLSYFGSMSTDTTRSAARGFAAGFWGNLIGYYGGITITASGTVLRGTI